MNGLLKLILEADGVPDSLIEHADAVIPAAERLETGLGELVPIWQKMQPLLAEAKPIVEKYYPDLVAVRPVLEEAFKFINSRGK